MSVNLNNVSIGEECTIKIYDNKKTQYSNIDKNKDFKLYNNNLLDDNIKSSICSLSDDKTIAYENCSLVYDSPYFVSDSSNNKYYCKISDSIDPINTFKKNYDKDIITTSNITSYIYNKYLENELCEEKWSDWFCIPNYHFENRYYNHIDEKDKYSKSIGKCYIPCGDNKIPNPYSSCNCINKELLGYPYFSYNPLATICLLGLNKDVFINNDYGYPKYIKNYVEKTIDKNIKLNSNIECNMDVITYINNCNLDNIWNDVKTDIQENSSSLYSVIPDFNTGEYTNIFFENIIEPDVNNEHYYRYFSEDFNVIFTYKLAEKIKKKYDSPDNDYKDYNDWKRELKDIHGESLKGGKLNFHIKIIKKCINICFDGKSKYSKDIFLILNKNDIKDPIFFENIDSDHLLNDIELNDFKIIKKYNKVFKNYTNIFDYIFSFINLYVFLIFIILIFIIFYIIYIKFYEDIVETYNYIYNLYIDNIYYALRKIIKRYFSNIPSEFYDENKNLVRDAVDKDNTETEKTKYILNSYINNKNKKCKYLKKNFLYDENIKNICDDKPISHPPTPFNV